jgi:protein-disulfide isomerase
MSNKREREKRREKRLNEEARATSTDRRARLLQLGAGAVFLVIVVVVVLIVVNSSSSESGGDSSEIAHVAEVNKTLSGIPQEKTVLGNPKASVELVEYGDLQCPVCKEYSEQILPQIMEGPVKKGQAKLVFHNFTIIGPQSIPAGTAALAAGEQGRGWTYIELFYRNQGKENSGYATDAFLEAVAKKAGVKNLAKWNEDRNSKRLRQELNATTSQAQNYGFTGTPSFAIKGPGTNGVKLLGTPGSTGSLEEAIEEAS